MTSQENDEYEPDEDAERFIIQPNPNSRWNRIKRGLRRIIERYHIWRLKKRIKQLKVEDDIIITPTVDEVYTARKLRGFTPPLPQEPSTIDERAEAERQRWLPKPRTHRKTSLRSSSTPPAERHRKAIEKHLKGRGARPIPEYRRMRKKKTSKEELDAQ